MSDIVGWDIGGAHLKLARVGDGVVMEVRQLPYALWQGVDRLAAATGEALQGWPRSARHALTMTAELADIFPDRAAGVRAILAVVEHAVGDTEPSVYSVDGAWLSAAAAAASPERVASANWHATARLVAAAVRDGVLIDVGSTTTDVVPLSAGAVVARGADDAERLALDELVYRGVVRTPVMAVAPYVELDGRRVGVMAELFATMADVYRLTGDLPGHADRQPSADGRGKSLLESRARLARMVGHDAASAPDATWDALARRLAHRQLELLREAAARVRAVAAVPAGAPVIGAGVGRFLAASLARQLGAPYRGFDELIEARTARIAASAADCAPAVAVALLASGA
jgi:(4-(4-[2-(gamma-L-glutamylamino)ethyl]phenoxymethyl)furan-2-yl)methanamine synthase